MGIIDKMIRIAGRDTNGKARAISVDDVGNQNVKLAGSDVAIPVDLQYHDIANTSPIPVRKGTIASATALPRSIRNATAAIQYVSVPNGAIGAIVHLNIFAVTGTFGDSQGIRINADLVGAGSVYSIARISTDRSSTPKHHLIVFNPGINAGDLKSFGDETKPSGQAKGTGFPIQGLQLGVSVSIDGTFDTGQGFDCAVVIDWLM